MSVRQMGQLYRDYGPQPLHHLGLGPGRESLNL